MKITKKYLLATVLSLTLAVVLASPIIVSADPCKPADSDYDAMKCLNLQAKYKEGVDLITVIGSVINILLGLLGVIAVVIIILGGFKWMTAGGGDEKIGEAKKLIGQGIVGLIIVLAAWAVAQFVMGQLKPKFLE